MEQPTLTQTIPGQPIPEQPITISREEVSYWQQEIKDAIKCKKEKFDDIIQYDTLVRYFEGFQNKIGTNIDTIAVLDEFSVALISVIAGTYYQNPTISATATRPDAEMPIQPDILFMLKNPNFMPYSRKDLMKAAVEYAIKKCGLKLEAQLALFDLLVAGFCVIEANHRSQNYEESHEDTVNYSPAESVVQGVRSVANKMVSLFDKAKEGSLSTQEVEEKVAQETADYSNKFQDQTYIKRWNPNEVLFDPRARVFKESRFITKVVKMSLADFNVNYPQFKNKIPKEFVSITNPDSKRKEDNKREVTVYESEIKQKDGSVNILCTAKGISEALSYKKRELITNNFTLKYGSIDKYGKIYPVSRAKKAQKSQDDLNHYATIQMEHADRSPRKIAVFMQGLSEAGKSAQNNSETYALVEKIIPGAVYEAMPQLPVSIDNEKLQLAFRDSINKHIGTSEVTKAGGNSDNEFATQDQLDSVAFQASTSQVQDALYDVLKEVLNTLKDIIMQFWDGQDYFMVTGIPGADAWYTPEMGPLADLLLGDYDIDLDIMSARKQNPQREQENAIKLIELLTGPGVTEFLMSKGYSVNLTPIKNAIKSFGFNPELIFEKVNLPPQGLPPIPIPIPTNGSQPQPQPEETKGVA